MKTNTIEVGDIVNVVWEHLEPLLYAEVTYIPCAVGDCWHLIKNGRAIYVQAFSRMDLINKGFNNERTKVH